MTKNLRGAAMVEYALIIALIAIVAIVAVCALGTEVSNEFSGVASELGSTNP